MTWTAISCVWFSLSYTHEHWPLPNIASTTMPSMSVRESPESEPCTSRLPPVHIALEPPTSNTPVVTEGTVPAMSWKLRPVGSESSSCWLTTSRRWLVCTSTTGDSPVTVTLSATAPTFISTLIGAVKFDSSRTSARRTVVKPVNVKVTVYVPGRRSTRRYWPASFVVVDLVFSMSAGLVASTVTPGSTAPVASFTTPAMALCANAAAGASTAPMIPMKTVRRNFRIASSSRARAVDDNLTVM